MNILDILRPFRKRLTGEAVLRSLIWAGLGVSALALTPCVLRLFIPEMNKRLLIICLIVGLFAAGFALCFLVLFRATYPKTAERLDELVCAERVGTMLEYAGVSTPAADAQRADTVRRMEALGPKDVRLRVSKPLAAAACVSAAAIIMLLILPGAQALESSSSRESAIGDLMQEMQEAIDNSEASPELKEALGDVVDSLGDALGQSQSGEEDQQAMQDASEQIGDAVEQAKASENSQEEAEAAEQLGEQLQKMLENASKELPEPGDQNKDEAQDGGQDKNQGSENDQDGAQDGQQNGEGDGQGDGSNEQNGGGRDGQSDGSQSDGSEGSGHEAGIGKTEDNMKASVYDPDSRKVVGYGKLYAAYCAGFAQAVEDGLLPDSTTNTMNEYLEKLKNGGQ